MIIGCGGHANSIVDSIEQCGMFEVAGYVVNENDKKCNLRYPILGRDDDLRRIFSSGIQYAVMGIGYLGKGNLRQFLYEEMKKIGYIFPTIIDSSAIVSRDAQIEEGTFIGKGVIINAGVQIERMCIINSGAIIEHDCLVEEFSHVSVGTVLCGNVICGKSVFIGANATIIQGRKIGNQCIIGAGEVIKKDILGKVYCE